MFLVFFYSSFVFFAFSFFFHYFIISYWTLRKYLVPTLYFQRLVVILVASLLSGWLRVQLLTLQQQESCHFSVFHIFLTDVLVLFWSRAFPAEVSRFCAVERRRLLEEGHTSSWVSRDWEGGFKASVIVSSRVWSPVSAEWDDLVFPQLSTPGCWSDTSLRTAGDFLSWNK